MGVRREPEKLVVAVVQRILASFLRVVAAAEIILADLAGSVSSAS